MKSLKFSVSCFSYIFLFLCISSCQKDLTTLRVRIDKFSSDSKIYMDGYTPMWDGSESVIVNGIVYQVNNTNSGNSGVISVASAAQYSAVFPSDYFVDQENMYSFVAPRFQEYKTDYYGRQLVYAPMGAYSNSGSSLIFTPLGSLLKITIDNRIERTMVIDSIVVKASAISLWGNAEIRDLPSSSRNFSITDEYSESHSLVSLVRRSESGERLPQSLGVNLSQVSSPVFYVFIPSVSNTVDNRFKISVYAHPSDGTMVYRYEMEQQNGYSGSYVAGQLANPVFVMSCDNEQELHDVSEGLLPGRFKIGEGHYVKFSKGNLQYNIPEDKWYFANAQYEIIGSGNEANRDSYGVGSEIRTVIDLFGYGTSGYNDKSPRLFYTDPSEYYYGDIAGTQYDWGVHNPIFNGGNQAGLWRTLSNTEWSYLLANNPTRLATIIISDNNSVHGIVVLPYGSGRTITQGNTEGWSTNTFTMADWQSIESDGALFLPAAGYRVDFHTYDIGDRLQYWTSGQCLAEGSAKCYSCYRNNSGSFVSRVQEFPTSYGFAVRLCRDVVE